MKIKVGDLVWYCDDINESGRELAGICLSTRSAKWDEKHVIYKVILCGGEIDEVVSKISNEDRIKVIQEREG